MEKVFWFFSKVVVLTGLIFIFDCVYKNEPKCEGQLEVADVVVVEGDFIREQVLSVAKGDSTYTERYYIHAYALNHVGYAISQTVEWRVSDAELINFLPLASEAGTKISVKTTKDLLDVGSETEPEDTITACVTNDCSYANKDDGCYPCGPEVCSNPLKIQSVINIEGSWRLEGATFPFPVEIYIQQTGHQIDTAFAANASINGREIIFDLGGFRYSCELENRESCVGDVVNTATSENLGVWTGTKI